MADNIASDDLCEYVACVEWKAAVDSENAKWRAGLFAKPQVRASLDGQPETISFLKSQFQVDLQSLAQ